MYLVATSSLSYVDRVKTLRSAYSLYKKYKAKGIKVKIYDLVEQWRLDILEESERAKQ